MIGFVKTLSLEYIVHFDCIPLTVASAVLPPAGPLFPEGTWGPGSLFHLGAWPDVWPQKLLNERASLVQETI